MYCNCLLTRLWRYKFWNQSYLSNQAVFPTWPKSRDKNFNIFRTKKAFTMKWKTFSIIFTGFPSKQIKYFFLEGESPNLVYTTMIILRHILYLVYLGPYLAIGLFLSCLYDVFLIFSPILIVVNHITSLNYTGLFFVHFLEYSLLFLGDNVDEESK